MSRLNPEGVRFVHGRVRPLDVDSMDKAAEVIAKEIARGPSEGTTPESWARHIAWVIGFDTLIDDRKAIRSITSLVVEQA